VLSPCALQQLWRQRPQHFSIRDGQASYWLCVVPDRPEIKSGCQLAFDPQHGAEPVWSSRAIRPMPFFSASAAFTTANLSALLSLRDGRPSTTLGFCAGNTRQDKLPRKSFLDRPGWREAAGVQRRRHDITPSPPVRLCRRVFQRGRGSGLLAREATSESFTPEADSKNFADPTRAWSLISKESSSLLVSYVEVATDPETASLRTIHQISAGNSKFDVTDFEA
jgi:hypothetical protein